MAGVAASSGLPIVLMHMQGTPQTMQKSPTYDDLMGDIWSFLAERIAAAVSAGISRDRIVVGPGLGFGKRIGHNFEILARLPELHGLGCPILVGASRKGFVGHHLGLEPADRLEGSLAALSAAVAAGTHIKARYMERGININKDNN